MLAILLTAISFFCQNDPLAESYLSAALVTRSYAIENAMIELRSARESIKAIRTRTKFTGREYSKSDEVQGNFSVESGVGGKLYFETKNKSTQKKSLEYFEKKQAEALKKLDELYKETGIPIISVSDLKKGDVGFLGRSPTLLVELKVMQVVSRSKALVTVDETIMMLSGMDTSGLTDGSLLDSKTAIVVSGTESYTALNGARRTVLSLEYISREKILEIHSAAQKLMPKRQRHYRDWKSLNGGFSVSAEYQFDDGKSVTLLKENGSTVVVPITKLSKEDREWLEKESYK